MVKVNKEEGILCQDELDSLLRISEFIDPDDENSLVEELKKAILDSGKLELYQWQKLRDHLRKIEELIPHIDLIIKLKEKK